MAIFNSFLLMFTRGKWAFKFHGHVCLPGAIYDDHFLGTPVICCCLTFGWGYTMCNQVQLGYHIYNDFSNFTPSVFPTCQVRVVRFYVSCLPPASSSSRPPPLLLVLLSSSLSSLSSSRCPRRPRCPPRPPAQLRLAIHSVRCRTSTTTIHAPVFPLPDLNHDHPRPVFPAGPQPRPSTPSVPCRTSTASIHAKCSLPDLM